MSMMRCGLVIGGGTHKYVTPEIAEQLWTDLHHSGSLMWGRQLLL